MLDMAALRLRFSPKVHGGMKRLGLLLWWVRDSEELEKRKERGIAYNGSIRI